MNVCYIALTALAAVLPYSYAIDTAAVFIVYNTTLHLPDYTGDPVVLSTNQIAYADQAKATTALSSILSCTGSAASLEVVCGTTFSPCSDLANCTSPSRSLVKCQCKDGFRDLSTQTFLPFSIAPPGTICQEIDECATDEDGCHPLANCVNTVGSFNCVCPVGYTMTAGVCEDTNECSSSILNSCHADATCFNTPGSYTCSCNNGFLGDGRNCTAVAATAAPTAFATSLFLDGWYLLFLLATWWTTQHFV